MMTLLIIAITVGLSILAFKNGALANRMVFWVHAIRNRKQYDRFITHGFIHADYTHLAFNMITLFFFGRYVEQLVSARIGAFGFLLFYLSAIVVAILPTYLRHKHQSNYMSLGASGAVSAMTTVFALVNPWSLIFVFFIPVPAIVYAALFIGYSIWRDRQQGDNVNHNAHLSGAIYGLLFMLAMEPSLASNFVGKLLNP